MTSIKLPFDAVIVLSRSDWPTQIHSNTRYYIKRFGESVPVFVVQGHKSKDGDTLITKEGNLHIINPKFDFTAKTLEMVFAMIPRSNRFRILTWVYNPDYHEALQYINVPTTIVYHVNEAYIQDGIETDVLDRVKSTINRSMLAISESAEISSQLDADKDILTPILTLSKDNEKCQEDKFNLLTQKLSDLEPSKSSLNKERKKNVLILYSKATCYVGTIEEHINAYGIFSRHQITFVDGTEQNEIDLDFLSSFDAVVIHYSIRTSVEGHLSSGIYASISKYNGLKILFIQDEYDNLPSTYQHIEDLKFDVIFTCVPNEYINYVYPRKRFPDVRFINNLTGYVSYKPLNLNSSSIENRATHVFYRGRKLPLFYGSLGLEKYLIGIKFKEIVNETKANLDLDVESDDAHRIYGNEWYDRLGSSKAMLGTESGSNVFDFLW